jgi:hypothetical protein
MACLFWLIILRHRSFGFYRLPSGMIGIKLPIHSIVHLQDAHNLDGGLVDMIFHRNIGTYYLPVLVLPNGAVAILEIAYN